MALLAGGALLTKISALLTSANYLQYLFLALLASLFIEPFFPSIGVRTAHDVVSSPVNVINMARVVVVGCVGVCFLYLSISRPSYLISSLKSPVGAMLVFALIALLSATYASVPFVAAGKAVELFVDVLFGLLIYALYSLEDARRSWMMLWGFLTAIMVAVWVSAFLNPHDGFELPAGIFGPLLQGWLPRLAPNTISQYGANFAIIALNRTLQGPSKVRGEKVLWGAYFLFGCLTLGAAQARTSSVAFIFTVFVCLFLHRKWLAMTLGAGVCLVGGLAGGLDQLLSYLQRNQSSEQILTLSGRTYYWTVAWNFFKTSKFLGHGFYTSTRVDLTALYSFMKHDLSTVDNTYLEVLLGVGVLGLIPLLIALAMCIRDMSRRISLSGKMEGLRIEMICCFVIIMIRSFTGSTFQVHSENLLAFLVIASFYGAAKRQSGYGVAR
ncbi:MAG: O-antigen ligase family protein [Bryobacteraceae bacterium]